MKGISRRMIFLAAVCAGVLAVVLTLLFLDAQRTRAAQMVQRVPVVVATRDIPARSIIEPDAVRVERRLALQAPQNSAGTTEQVVGKVALELIGTGEPVLGAKVAPRNSSLGLAYVVKPDMRAVTVALDPIIGVAGYLKPGDHVDVLATFVVDEVSITKTVLQDVELLALGSKPLPTEVKSREGGNARAEQQPNATLSVAPDQAEKLILADSRGKLRLSLRAVGDDARISLPGVNTVALIGYTPRSAASNGYVERAAPQRPPVTSVGYTSPAFYGGTGAFFDRPRTRPLDVTSALQTAPGKEVEVVRGTEKSVVRVSE